MVRGAGLVVVAFGLGAALAAPAAGPASTRLRAGVTSLQFSVDILADLGIELVDVAETRSPLRDGALGFAVDVPASSVALDADGGDYEGFAAADLRHAGRFALRLHGARVDLAAFRLTEAAAPYALVVRDAQGRRWFLVDKPHAVLAPDLLSLANADLLIAPELAALLRRPDLSG